MQQDVICEKDYFVVGTSNHSILEFDLMAVVKGSQSRKRGIVENPACPPPPINHEGD